MKSVTFKLGTFALIAALTACGGGGGGGGSSLPPPPGPTATPPIPGPTATPPIPGPTSTPLIPASATCLANGLSAVRAPQSISGGVTGADGITRVMPGRTGNAYIAGQLAVQYHVSQAAAIDRAALSVAQNGNSNVVTDLHFAHSDLATRVVRVDESKLDATAATLRQQPGVVRVDRVGARQEMSSNPFFANDPYFDGRNASPTPQPGPQLYAGPNYPGQWDMHIMGLENVFGYSQPGNAIAPNANALGSSLIKLAVIDTGMDTSLPDLGPASRVQTTQCYITPQSGPQTHTQNVSDFDGHGTNVTGIAAAQVNNGFGFVGAGGNVSMLLYRIFPKGGPNDGNASSIDEASAIDDAISRGANVISLSLGSSSQDQTENTAIEGAISAGVVVVAAAGNDSTAKLDYPAAYPGVIAVGATGIDDTGAEHVAKYSNYDSTNSAMWGLVAPGGDPSGSSDTDFLHWIQNTYSLRVAAPDQCRAALGKPDFFGENGNCSVLIAGTSQATPHVAGAVAMLLSVKPSLITGTSATASQVKSLLFASTHDIADPKQGAGRLNEYYLIANALGDTQLPQK
ncbi:MAG: S8 family serine peptidase [Candidatus Baltobacteraceae bacterium]